MNHTTRSATLPFVLLVLATPGLAAPRQGTPIEPVSAQGLFSTFALGMTVGDGITPDALLIRAPGVNGGVPTPWTAASFTPPTQVHPDYSFDALTNHWKPAGFPAPSFGGISTGGEVMPPIDHEGHLQMISSNWYMLAVSVDSNAVGEPGSVLEMQRMGGRDASGDIISYYADGSLGINPAFVDTVRLESSREQLRIDQVLPSSSGTRSIRNFDWGIGIRSIDPGLRVGSMFPIFDCFYFTLTLDWLSQVPGLQLGGQPASAATVYVMTWNATATPPWSQPAIAFAHDMLLDPEISEDVEIDALSVDRGGVFTPAHQPLRVVFSLTPASNAFRPSEPFDQILVYQRYTMTEATALLTDPAFGPPQRFSEKIGLVPAGAGGDPDNVTGTCGGDPIERYRIYPVVAMATDQPRQGAGTLGFSALRTCNHVTPGSAGADKPADTLHLQVTGMDYSPHAYGVLQLYLESDVPVSGPPGPSTPWGDPFWVSPTMTQRNALELAGPIACAIDGKKLRMSAQMFGVDFNSDGFTITPLRESWVLSIER